MIAYRIGAERPARRQERRAVTAAVKRRIAVLSGSPGNVSRIDPHAERGAIKRRMSQVMGIVRNIRDVTRAFEENGEMIRAHRSGGTSDREGLLEFVRNGDLLITERAFLASAKFLLEALSGPRGSFLVGDADDVTGWTARDAQEGRTQVVPDESLDDRIVECTIDDDFCAHTRFVPVRPIPRGSLPFERVWAEHHDGAVYRNTPENGRKQ